MNIARRPGTNSRYESLWSRLHKLAYLNAASLQDIQNLVGVRDAPHDRDAWTDTSETLAGFGWLAPEKLCTAFGIGEEELRLSVCHAYRIQCNGDTPAGFLRYCPACIEQGFHTAVFQLSGVVRCPVHRLALRGACPVCKKGISYRLRSRMLSNPYGCPCGAVLWPARNHPVWPAPRQTDHDRTFGEFARWAERLKPGSMGPYDARPRYPGMRVESLRGFATLLPVPGWSSEDFGGQPDSIEEHVYAGESLPIADHFKNVTAVIVSALHRDGLSVTTVRDVREPDAFHQAFQQRATAIDATIRGLLGRHVQCRDSAAIDFLPRYCFWEDLYELWRHGFTRAVTGQYYLPYYIDQALLTADAVHALFFRASHPWVVWFASQLFAHVLWSKFIDYLLWSLRRQPFWESPHRIGQRLRVSYPAMVYLPHPTNGGPKIKAYLGISRCQVKTMTDEGRGCNNRGTG